MALDKKFNPKKNFNLIRCGRNNDGGYLVSNKTILEAKTLIAFGILDDCSFESDFIKINPVNVYCYDHTVNNTYWKKRIYNDIGASLYNFNWPFIKNTLTRYFEFRNFFKIKSNYLDVKTIGTSSIKKILSENNFPKPLFFKIDIEGSEYRILDELIEFQDNLCGLVIEFHDLDLNLDRVKNFINNFQLPLTHIHPNNYGSVDEKNDPLVIEMTFEKHPEEDRKSLIFPNKFDQPNNPNNKDIILNFE